MSIVETRVEVEDLQPGMYVCRLDRPWNETDFRIQGGLIQSQKDIDRLARFCRHVYIDKQRSHLPETSEQGQETTSSIPTVDSRVLKQRLIGHAPRDYPLTKAFDEELQSAREAHQQLSRQILNAFSDIRQQKDLRIEDLDQVVTPMVDSMIRNPDAFTWLSRLRRSNDYDYHHAISTSIWGIALGRHLGLPREQLLQLGTGGLLLDVGKLRLPSALIEKPGPYNEYERKIIRKHVAHSLDIVSRIQGIPPEVLSMVEQHHERHDGSGYPQGLEGVSIPLAGRIMGLADCYAAITADRPYARALSPHEVVRMLYQWRDADFQAELIEQFIQVIGVYPVGTLVELSTGQVAVVIAQHRTRRLRPKVMLLLDASKRPYADFDVVDLKNVRFAADGEALNIERCLEPGTHGIDPGSLYL